MLNWHAIDTVLLDMDGTLLDLHFDNHFWLEHLPKNYGKHRNLSPEHAKIELFQLYHKVKGTLDWYCVDYWTQTLGLDVAALKAEVGHLITVHPHVLDFLQLVGNIGKKRILVSNAHQKSIALKMSKTSLALHLERIISAHDIGLPKEHPEFWSQLQTIEAFDPKRTLFIDDTPNVLESARAYGISWLVAITCPDSKKAENTIIDFLSIRDFSELMPTANHN